MHVISNPTIRQWCENYGASSGVKENSSRLSSSSLSILASTPVSASEDDESFESSAFHDSLPSFTIVCALDFMWDSIPGDSFLHSVDCCYEEGN